MIAFKFFINDIEVEEPRGFNDITFRLARDKESHGMVLEAALSELGFLSDGADLLMELWEVDGIKSKAVLEIEYSCDGQAFELGYEGNLDFRTYKEQCGTSCLVLIAVEQKGCALILKNRANQKVDIDSNIAFNKITQLQDYDGLKIDLTFPGVALDARVEGNVAEDGETVVIPLIEDDTESFGAYVRPTYEKEKFNGIETGGLLGGINFSLIDEFEMGLTPQLLYDDVVVCFNGPFEYNFRFKGRFSINAAVTGFTVSARLATWDGSGDMSDNLVTVEVNQFVTLENYVSGTIMEFDVSFADFVEIDPGLGFYGFLEFAGFDYAPNTADITVQFDTETYVLIKANKLCPSSIGEVSMINEVGSRIIEAVTDGCMRMKSDYYGRVDSEPIQSLTDGNGSLRCLIPGLKLRKAENPKFFLSWNDYFFDLKAIDNIGFGIEPDEFIPGRDWVRVEPVKYFYQDKKIMDIDGVPKALKIVNTDVCYSVINVGYETWEVQKFNGLDEPNSKKTFRTSLDNIDNVLDIVSKFIAGSLPIEKARQETYANTGGADTSYDNETFIICVKRGSGAYYSAYPYEGEYVVETGNIENASGMYSPETYYNWRIRPFYNLMRWAKSIFNVYTNLFSSTSKLFFTNGEGNLIAKGELPESDLTRLENGPKAENKDLSIQDFANAEDYTPIYTIVKLYFSGFSVNSK